MAVGNLRWRVGRRLVGRGAIVGLGEERRQREEVARRGRAVGDEGEDLREEGLLS